MEPTINNKEVEIQEFPVTTSRKYVDLDLAFNAHPLTGDIGVLVNTNAVKRSCINLIMTSFYERPFDHAKGTRIRRNLFENYSQTTNVLVAEDIKNVISHYEPRVTVKNVSFNNGRIYMKLTIKNSGEIELSHSLSQ